MMMQLESYLPVFKQVLQMTNDPDQSDDYEQSRQTCIDLFEQASWNAKQQDLSEGEKESARVAVIAWIDETILRSNLPWRLRWQSELLQRKYLNITVAGEYFFTLLSQLDILSTEARKVFLFCLQQGFKGQYSSPDDRPALIELIDEQRRLCLPEVWQEWPNDAAIVPTPPVATSFMTQHLQPLLTRIAGILLLYSILYFSLHHYVS